jgi:predicted dehydrogenase/threonine dehydrogenase-like Zn-dependent dehydrogenase
MRQILMNMGGAVVARVPRPVVERGAVLVRVHYSLISVGTEIAPLRSLAQSAPDSTAVERGVVYAELARHYLRASLRDPRKAVERVGQIARRQARRMLAGHRPRVAEPSPGSPIPVDTLPPGDLDDQGWSVGYSAAGEVVAVGDGVTDLAAGDLVACAGAGQANHADYISVKRNLVCRLPAGCPVDVAASATIGAIALQGVRRLAPQLGERVCVLGLGLIGQITAQLLRASGCEVLGLDLDPARVERARSFGMERGASTPESFTTLVRDATEGRGADRTIMTAATKSHSVVNLAMNVTRAKGVVVIVGDVGLKVEREVFYRKEIDLLMSTSYGPGRYDPSYEAEGHDYPFAYVRWTLNRNMQAYLDLVAKGRVQIQPLIDRVIAVDEAPAAYRSLADADGPQPLGVLIRYADGSSGSDEAAGATRIVIRGHKKAAGGVLKYALVGAGAFGTGMLVPQMAKRRDRFFLKAIVSRNASQGGNANQVEVVTSSIDDVLNDPDVDLAVIATRHHEHAAQMVRALRAGKHVFVEKPLALTWDELSDVVAAYRALEAPPLALVGFNRRFSPALTAVKAITAARRAPLVIEYRLNGGYIALDHWVQTSQGGGRNLGEACHMYDVFRFLTGSAARSIVAEAIDPGPLPYRRDDNFSATITYEDGSLAHLLYTSLGPKEGLGKERLEIFCDGEAYVVDDYKALTRASDGAMLWQASEPDKGHFAELSQFGDAIASGAASPIPFEELVETSAVALHVQDLLSGRFDDQSG